jgi:hypothetical protein
MIFAASASGTHPPTGSDPFVAVVVAIVVLMVGLRVARRVARIQRDQRFVKLLMWSLVLHVLCAPAQIFIVDHLYNGVADYTAYVNRGAFLAENLRSGMFTFANTKISGFTGDNVVYILSGVVQTVLGANKLAEFVFFSGVAFLGEVCFLRAFSTTFPEVNPRRYAFLIFFLPSLLFWTADISKETIMTLALGLAAYGAARVLMRVKGGYKLLVAGLAIGIILRPNEVVLLLAGLAVAMLFPFHRREKTPAGVEKAADVRLRRGRPRVRGCPLREDISPNGIADEHPSATPQREFLGSRADVGKQQYRVLVEPALLSA